MYIRVICLSIINKNLLMIVILKYIESDIKIYWKLVSKTILKIGYNFGSKINSGSSSA